MLSSLTLRKKTHTNLESLKTTRYHRLLIASMFATLGVLQANESAATTYYGIMTGTITGYTDITIDPFNSQNFSNWFFGDNRNPIGQSIEIDFMVSDAHWNDGGPNTPVVNNSSDPAHYGTYTGGVGTSSGYGNLRMGPVFLGGKNLSNTTRGSFTETLINDVAPGDQFKWTADVGYFSSYVSTLDFSLTTQQNILSSGYAAQEFYWLANYDLTGVGTGSLLTHRYNPFQTNYTFAIDRLSLTLSSNPTPPAPVPLPASAWLFGSALLGLGRIARRHLN